MDLDIDAFVELDRINMAPIIEKAGGSFNPQFRRERMLLELEEGATFLFVQKRGLTVAYLETMREADDTFNVMSIQIHPSFQKNCTLRDLLVAASKQLLVKLPREVRTSVHFNNHRSLKLHRKLGFEETQEKDGRILFRIDGAQLCQRLAQFNKNNTTNWNLEFK